MGTQWKAAEVLHQLGKLLKTHRSEREGRVAKQGFLMVWIFHILITFHSEETNIFNLIQCTAERWSLPVPEQPIYPVHLDGCLHGSCATFSADFLLCIYSQAKRVYSPSHFLSKATSSTFYFSKHRKCLPLIKCALKRKTVYLETERLFLGFKVWGESTELAGRKMGLLNL